MCGDFNIDLLKINVKQQYATFYNCLVSARFFPHISLPTRVTNHSATLLDNIIAELSDHESAVIVKNISDHQMICTYSTITVKNLTSFKKFIEVEKSDHQAMEKFLNELKNSNIIDQLNLDEHADPNLNFNRFMENFMKLKEQHLPKEVVRFDRKKTQN